MTWSIKAASLQTAFPRPLIPLHRPPRVSVPFPYTTLFRSKVSFRQALSIVCHAGLVGLVAAPIRIVTANLAQNPQITLGPGALLPLADQEGFAMKFLAGFLQGFDVFSIWQTVLVALGVSVIGRVGYRASLFAMFALFVVFSLIGALLGAFTG